ARWPKTRIIIRADSGFCRDAIMAWCETNDVGYVLGLARNKVSAPESTPFFRTPSATDFLLSHHNAGECHGPDRQY
ncbi:transposase, partial [Thiolapillus sp.]|uniref:transposase n=2 Tax=Thiolapillus sp. TaxID=2017437 RepID=UPI003AF4B7C3